MRKTMLIICLVILLPGVSHGAAYILGNYGFGGKMDATSWGAELGGVFLSDLHPNGDALSVGVGFSVGMTDDNKHTSGDLPAGAAVVPSKKYNDGNEYEGYLNFGAELLPSLFGTVGVGYSSQKTISIAQYYGLAYETNSGTDNYVTGMVGMRYVVQGFAVGVGFHTRRGVALNLGFAF